MAVKKTPPKKVDHKLTATQKMHLKNLLQKELPKNTFDKLCTDLGLNASLPKGMTKAVARNIKITGLSKTTGRILKGYKYAKGGKIVKVAPKK